MSARYDEERFFSKVEVVDECWVWTSASRGGGYGAFWFRRRYEVAHRWCYEFLRAPIPPKLHLDHLCRNRACVNPWHLEPVSARVNTLRGWTRPAANLEKKMCPQGHLYAGANLRITPTGRRVCRACHRANAARSRHKAVA